MVYKLFYSIYSVSVKKTSIEHDKKILAIRCPITANTYFL